MSSFRLPIRTVSTLNTREHWSKRARRTKLHRGLARMKARSLGWILPEPCTATCTITRIGPRKLDGDNLQGALKGIRDAIADALGIDDGSDRITWVYKQAKGKPREYAVIVEIGDGQT